MPSMGALGAISGGATALSGVLQGNMDEARKTRLENLRTSNNQATNTLNNQERHDFSMAEKEKGQEYSLAELAQRQTNAAALSTQGATEATELSTHQSGLRSAEPTPAMKDAAFYRDEGGVDVSTQYKDSLKTGRSGYGSGLPADAKMIDYLKASGMSQEDAFDWTRYKAETSPSEFKRNMLSDLSESGIYDQEQIMEIVANTMKMAYPEKPGGSAPAPAESAPDTSGDFEEPKQAGNGKFYIKRNGKFLEVKE